MTSGEAQRRSGAGALSRDAAAGPVRTRTSTEQRSVSTALWCRGISLVLLLLSLVVGVLYASAKMRFVEDVLPKISDPFTFWAFNVVVASFAVVPGAASATSIAAGVIYGTPLGVALVGTSCAVGAGVSFIIARYAARPIVEKIFLNTHGERASKFAALDQAVMRDGAQIVLLTRLSPLSPYVAMSFAFGLTAVDFAPYIAASAVGILPASTLYVYLGDTGRRAAGTGGTGTSKLEIAFYAFGLIITALVTARITKLANDALEAKVDTPRIGSARDAKGRSFKSRNAANVVKPSAWNLWGFFRRKNGQGGEFDVDIDEDSDFDSYYDGSDDEDERTGMLEMAERGARRDLIDNLDIESSDIKLESERRRDETRSGVFLVSDPMVGPVPLGPPTPKS